MASLSDGFLLLDKPAGISSFQALGPVKRSHKGRKVGHAGTLDPAATGLLLAAIGHGTRLLEFLEGMDKVYRFGIRLGVSTDTYDLEGEIIEERDASAITREQVLRELPAFLGDQMQVPPSYSAIKIQGKRACDRVRDGEIIELPARHVHIYRLDLIDFEPGLATLEMHCTKGTYVRSIAHDLGEKLGCGAATATIRRLAIGPFLVADAVAPDAASETPLKPLSEAVRHLPGLKIKATFVAALLNGNAIPPAGYQPYTPEFLVTSEASMEQQIARFSASKTPALDPDTNSEPSRIYALYGEEQGESPRLLAVGGLNPMGGFQPRKVLVGS